MPSSFTRVWPSSGGGNTSTDGHKDAVIHVLQRETTGAVLKPETERDNDVSKTFAQANAQPPTGLILDNIRTERFGTTPSAILWIFEYSNDKFFDFSGLSIADALPNGTFGQTVNGADRSFPALIKREVPIFGPSGGLNPVTYLDLYTEFELSTRPEPLITWQVKTTTNQWNFQTAVDIAIRTNTMHLIFGNYYQFGGAVSVDKIDDDNYDIVYEWIIDPGTRDLSVRSEQPGDGILILPPKVPAGDQSLSVGFGPGFQADTYLRLPYHEIVIGVPDPPAQQPPFLQVSTTTFNPAFSLDWQLLPGDPVNAV